MELVWRLRAGGLFWIVGPDYEQCRPELQYVIDSLYAVDDIKTMSVLARGPCMVITKTGSRIVTKSARSPERLAGEAPDGILLCEAAQCSYEVYLRLRGRVAEKRGWLWLSGTFEGSQNGYAEKFNQWSRQNPEGGESFSMPSWENSILYPGGYDDPEIRALRVTYPKDLFLERFGGQPTPPSGLVFREFNSKVHVEECPVNWSARVELAIDPGYAGAYAVLALQWEPGLVRVVDEIYVSQHVAATVIRECRSRKWWDLVTGGVIDIAGRQHHAMPSQVEIWQAEAGIHLRFNRVGLLDGIARLRTYLEDPATGEARIVFDPKCVKTIREFGKYQYREVLEGRPIPEEPIDRDNHALKALSYWLVDRFGSTRRRRRSLMDFRMV